MANCKKCYKNHHNVIADNCSFCQKIAFKEEILCSLLQPAQNDVDAIDCFAYKPNLSVVGSVEKFDEISQGEDKLELPNISHRHKWLKAYMLQQSASNPDQIITDLSFHICLITKNRKPLFLEDEIDLSIFFSEAGSQFDGYLEVLSNGKDHIHLYANSSPDYSLDDIVNKTLSFVLPKIKEEYPELFKEKNSLFENAYFAESIG